MMKLVLRIPAADVYEPLLRMRSETEESTICQVGNKMRQKPEVMLPIPEK